MKALSAQVDRFFFDRFDGRICAAFRISTGGLMLLWTLANGPNWCRDYCDDGMLFPTQSWSWVIPAWFAMVALSISYLIGWKSKWCAVALYLLHEQVLVRNQMASNAEQGMFRMQLFYAFFMPIGEHFSLDGRNRHRANHWHQDPEWWQLRTIQFHCCLIYIIGSLNKWTTDVAWQNGDAIYYAMMHEEWAKWPWPKFFYQGWATKTATWGSFVAEASFGLLCWVRDVRPFVTTLLILFHITVALTLDHVGFFSMAMACNLLCFYEWSDFEKLRNRLSLLGERSASPA